MDKELLVVDLSGVSRAELVRESDLPAYQKYAARRGGQFQVFEDWEAYWRWLRRMATYGTEVVPRAVLRTDWR